MKKGFWTFYVISIFCLIFTVNGFAKENVLNLTLANGKKLKTVFLEGEFGGDRTLVIGETICRAKGEWIASISKEVVGIVTGQIIEISNNEIKLKVNDSTYVLKNNKDTKFCDGDNNSSLQKLEPGMTITATAKSNGDFELNDLLSVQLGFMKFIFTNDQQWKLTNPSCN